MIVEIGHYALALALGVSVIQAVVPFWGVFRQDRTLASVGSSAAPNCRPGARRWPRTTRKP